MDKPPKTHWNHRVIRRERNFNGEKYITFGIHEVYYTNGEPTACTMEPVEPHGETLEELQQSMEWFAKALQHPVLEFDDIGKSDDELFREACEDIDPDNCEPF